VTIVKVQVCSRGQTFCDLILFLLRDFFYNARFDKNETVALLQNWMHILHKRNSSENLSDWC